MLTVQDVRPEILAFACLLEEAARNEAPTALPNVPEKTRQVMTNNLDSILIVMDDWLARRLFSVVATGELPDSCLICGEGMTDPKAPAMLLRTHVHCAFERADKLEGGAMLSREVAPEGLGVDSEFLKGSTEYSSVKASMNAMEKAFGGEPPYENWPTPEHIPVSFHSRADGDIVLVFDPTSKTKILLLREKE